MSNGDAALVGVAPVPKLLIDASAAFSLGRGFDLSGTDSLIGAPNAEATGDQDET